MTTDHTGFWHVDLTTLIGALALFFAWRAATAAMTTVRDTREMRWEANLNRVLEALASIEAAAGNLAENRVSLSSSAQRMYMQDSHLELRRALVFPRVLTENAEANNILDLLEMADNLAADPAKTRAYARRATQLLSTRPPGENWPMPVLMAMTFVPRKRAQLREWRARRSGKKDAS